MICCALMSQENPALTLMQTPKHSCNHSSSYSSLPSYYEVVCRRRVIERQSRGRRLVPVKVTYRFDLACRDWARYLGLVSVTCKTQDLSTYSALSFESHIIMFPNASVIIIILSTLHGQTCSQSPFLRFSS